MTSWSCVFFGKKPVPELFLMMLESAAVARASMLAFGFFGFLLPRAFRSRAFSATGTSEALHDEFPLQWQYIGVEQPFRVPCTPW